MPGRPGRLAIYFKLRNTKFLLALVSTSLLSHISKKSLSTPWKNPTLVCWLKTYSSNPPGGQMTSGGGGAADGKGSAARRHCETPSSLWGFGWKPHQQWDLWRQREPPTGIVWHIMESWILARSAILVAWGGLSWHYTPPQWHWGCALPVGW